LQTVRPYQTHINRLPHDALERERVAGPRRLATESMAFELSVFSSTTQMKTNG
jgi:hypothetical protein